MVSQARTSPVKPQPSQVVRRDKFDQVWFSWGPCSSQGRLIGSWESATRLFECSANSVGAVWMLHLTPAWCTKAILGQPRAFLRELGVVEWLNHRRIEKWTPCTYFLLLLAATWHKTVKTVTGFPLFRYCFVLFLLYLLFWTFEHFWTKCNDIQRASGGSQSTPGRLLPIPIRNESWPQHFDSLTCPRQMLMADTQQWTWNVECIVYP